MFKNILVAIDGSGTAAKGFQTALGLAREQSARLNVLHVVDERGRDVSVRALQRARGVVGRHHDDDPR